MKYTYTLLFFALMAQPSFSQNMGTIEVNSDYTATLSFADSIVFIVIGNNPPLADKHFKFYDIYQSGKSCVIRGNDPKAPNTSITVKLENEKIWYGKLHFGDSTKIFYDFAKDENTKKVERKIQEVATVQDKESKMKERMNSVLSDPIEYNTIGTIENSMTFQVGNIKNDENFTYFKLIIKNGTGSDYNIDGIYFKFVEGKRKGVNRNEAKIEERLKIAYVSPVKIVNAYKTEELGYIIERFTGSKKGSLNIQLREANGTRNPVITISGDKILGVKVFEQKL
ncbi:MAG: DUF4138 domain-containing protein [Tenuifilaceae bacterium]